MDSYNNLIDSEDPTKYNSNLTEEERETYREDFTTAGEDLNRGLIIGGVGLALATGGALGLVRFPATPMVGPSGLVGLQVELLPR